MLVKHVYLRVSLCIVFMCKNMFTCVSEYMFVDVHMHVYINARGGLRVTSEVSLFGYFLSYLLIMRPNLSI